MTRLPITADKVSSPSSTTLDQLARVGFSPLELRTYDGTVGNMGTPARALSSGDMATPGKDVTRDRTFARS